MEPVNKATWKKVTFWSLHLFVYISSHRVPIGDLPED